jgi:acetylornithine deacetylase/succinyl-diaminopimelate desuccinylase-like protein
VTRALTHVCEERLIDIPSLEPTSRVALAERTEAGAFDGRLERLVTDPAVARAVDAVRAGDADTLALQVELSEIAAPTFDEHARATRVAELFAEAGLGAVRLDGAGNVIGEMDGIERTEPLVLSAHLDTVFPAGTDVAVTREGDTLRGPGIADDARGLAVLVSVARHLERARLSTRRPILFAATVAEEGLGDLGGVKHLFGPQGSGRGAAGFISIDGAGLDRVIVRGIGSRRFRIGVRGPGGHSWNDWGTSNPIHALATAVQRLAARPLPGRPTTTLTVARWGGGRSVNSIPERAWIEVDTRSESGAELEALDEFVHAVAAECAPPGGHLTVEVDPIGNRPAGETPPDSALVRAAIAATRAVGGDAQLTGSSTDANFPMSLGIAAITMGGGGLAGQAHTAQEWYRNVRGEEGVIRALYTALLAAS